MMMSKTKIHISKCDRCDKEQSSSIEHDSVFYDWGHFWFAQINGPNFIKMKKIPTSFTDTCDLCPECMLELKDWFNKLKT